MSYEPHTRLRISIDAWEPAKDPAKMYMGVTVEDALVLWVASTNAREVAEAVRKYVDGRFGLDLDTHGVDPARTTSFSVKYSVPWSPTGVQIELHEAITSVNVKPKPERLKTQIPPTRYPAGTVRV